MRGFVFAKLKRDIAMRDGGRTKAIVTSFVLLRIVIVVILEATNIDALYEI